MLALPLPRTDPIRLADWMELEGWSAGEVSTATLEQALRVEGEDQQAIESLRAQVYAELEERRRASAGAYPFALLDGVLRRVDDTHPAYDFCLVLSYWTWPAGGLASNGRRLFEQLSSRAAANYLGGDAVRFGHPRMQEELPPQFLEAIDELCRRLGEGEAGRQAKAFNFKDDSVDIVAWKDFPDRYRGKLIMFGQCASGRDWEEKLTDLLPDKFCEFWMSVQPFVPAVRGFFVPHRLDGPPWEHVARNAGILFERCRLAYWVESDPGTMDAVVGWIQQARAAQGLIQV